MADENLLHEAQRWRLFSNARHADKLLSEIEAIVKTAANAAQAHAHLRDLARSLAACWQRTAAALDANDALAEEVLIHTVHEMPRFDTPTVNGGCGRPRLPLSQTFARKRADAMLRGGIEDPLTQAFATYARLVEGWARLALAELRLQFDSTADAYPAQISRLIAHDAVDSGVRQAILGVLARLRET